MTITIYALAVFSLVVVILWAEDRIADKADNAFIWARDAYDDWWWARHARAQNAARIAARHETRG